MSAKGREEQIERWAEYVKTRPEWKVYHTQFINAQYEKVYAFIDRLSKTKDGQKKIVELYGIKNVKGYPVLLKDLQ